MGRANTTKEVQSKTQEEVGERERERNAQTTTTVGQEEDVSSDSGRQNHRQLLFKQTKRRT
jgi:hypothetical protein